MINFFSRSNYKLNRKIVAEKISSYLKKYGFTDKDSLNVIFIGRRKMREIAKKYKKEDSAFPILSFSHLWQNNNIKTQNFPSLPTDERLIGEIFICYPQAVLLAAEREREVDTIIIELIKHGIENIISNHVLS